MSNIAAFLDRDGVINEEVNLLHREEQLKLIPGSAQAIKQLNKNNIKAIVVTNQSVVARGLCTEKEVDQIHDRLQEMLNNEGAHLDAIYFCPHHENADLKQYRKNCPNRKPKPGMLTQAASEFKLNLKDCYVVGDSTCDIKAGENVGYTTILVKTGHGGRDGKYQVQPDHIVADLKEAAELITKELIAESCKVKGKRKQQKG